MFRSMLLLLALFIGACAPSRPPVPPGIIPEPGMVSLEDERYGHEVLSLLTNDFPIDHDDARINRVRRIVDALTANLSSQADPWHVYVLKDDSIKNAAATRGNYIFVWSGMVNEVKTDGELAAILAHEIGHVLARHTEPSPQEEVSSIISGVAGQVAHEVVARQGEWGVLAGLAQILIEESINAMLVNPELQEKELEADQIGLFLMAEANYNPEEAFTFWDRVKDSPDFSEFPVQFLSSHPSSTERVENIRANLPLASKRFLEKSNSGVAPVESAPPAASKERPAPAPQGSGSEWDWGSGNSKSNETFSSGTIIQEALPGVEPSERGETVWEVLAAKVSVFQEPSPTAPVVQSLLKGTHVTVKGVIQQRNPSRRWVRIINPVIGYAESRHLAPVKP